MQNSEKERILLKYDVINRYIGRKITRVESALELGCHQNNISRLVKKFEAANPNSFAHGGNGLKKAKKFSTIDKEIMVNLLEKNNQQLKNNVSSQDDTLESCNFSMLASHRLILRNLNYKISLTHFTKIMNNYGIYSPKIRVQKDTTNATRIARISNYKSPGTEWQIDGKMNLYLPGEEHSICAHVVVDASSDAKTIIGVYFDYEETTSGYLNMLKSAFETYGIPKQIVTDGRMSYNTLGGEKNPLLAQIFKELNIDQIITSNPRRNGKVESKHRVVKDLVMKHLRLMGIKTLKEANENIQDVLKIVNYDLKNEMPAENNLRKVPKNYNYDIKFAHQSVRSINSDSTIRVNNRNYFIINANNKVMHIKKKTKVTVYRNYQQEILIKHQKRIYKTSVATDDSIEELVIENQHSQYRSIETNGYNFRFKNYHYYATKPNGNEMKFNPRTKVEVYYRYKKSAYEVIAIKENNIVYKTKTGTITINNDEYTVVQRKTKFDNSFKINHNQYILIDLSGKQIKIGESKEVKIELKNNIPQTAIFKNKKYNLFNMTISKNKYVLPKSRYVAKQSGFI